MTGTPALTLYRALTRLGGPLLARHVHRRMAEGKEDPARLGERFGYAGEARPAGTLVWVHGASVGEAMSVYPLIERLCAAGAPAHVLLTTGTVTSARLSAERLPIGARHQFAPIDRPGDVERFLDHWRPDSALWVESELWPNLVTATAGRGIPMVLVNARMSAASARRWRYAPGLVRTLLHCFTLCLAQSEVDGERLSALGARLVRCPGNLKDAAPPLPVNDYSDAGLGAAILARPRWLAASTHDGEEATAGEVHTALEAALPGLLTLVVPRHPDRGGAIATRLRSQGLNVAQRSRDEPITHATDVYLADTLGELGYFYRLAGIAFVGGSLVPHGGQNPLEPARLDCALLTGPHTDNFAPIMSALRDAEAVDEVSDAVSLARAVENLLNDDNKRIQRAQAARAVATAASDVLDRVMAEIAPFLPAPPACADARSRYSAGA